MHTEIIDYRDGDLVCEGWAAYDDTTRAKRPGVLVCHAWGGQSDLERDKAQRLAELGYVGYAADLFGKGVRGGTMERNRELITPFIEDRALLRARLAASLGALRAHPLVDNSRLAAIGYCFGGLCVLDLARSVPDGLRGVVSFHGLLHPPSLGEQSPITSRILILHGWDDPLATPEHVLAVAKELSGAGADWQLHAYGGTQHAFTNPGASQADHGLVYNETADRRSWQAMRNFLHEVLA
jgi:dienelactone hydrolase